jgi:hypothetical protein
MIASRVVISGHLNAAGLVTRIDILVIACSPRPDQLTFFVCRDRDDVPTLQATKGQQFRVRAEAGLGTVEFHRAPAQFAAGRNKRRVRGRLHHLAG